MKEYRDNGAIGALLDEYEKALNELLSLLDGISNEELHVIVDNKTKDEDCRSIRSILHHVTGSGRTYAIEIRKSQGEKIEYWYGDMLDTVAEYRKSLLELFRINVQLFEDYPDIEVETKDLDKKMTVRWGQLYDVEQLMEHAIVHILRHRRQIERFLIKIRT